MIIVVMGEQNLYKYLMMRTINITQPSFGTKEIMLIKIPLTIKNFMHYGGALNTIKCHRFRTHPTQ